MMPSMCLALDCGKKQEKKGLWMIPISALGVPIHQWEFDKFA